MGWRFHPVSDSGLKGLHSAFCPATAVHGCVALSFVIPPAPACRGGICSSADLSWKCFSTEEGPTVSVYSSSIWRSNGGDCMQSSWAIFFRAAFKAELGQGSTVTTKGRRSFG
jgi:hypothetical protein